MSFIYKEALWLIILAPIAAFLLFQSFRARRSIRNNWGNESLIGKGSSKLESSKYLSGSIFYTLGLVLLALAIARPYLENGKSEFPQGTTDLITLVDVSRSMAALDYKDEIPKSNPFNHGTRLDMARYLIMKEVVPSLGANRLGIVTYTGKANVMAFLTKDVSAVDWVHRRAMEINSVTGDGSALVKALNLACKLFDLDSAVPHRRIIVLFSDGGNDDGFDALQAVLKELAARKVELIVVGLGKLSDSAIPVSELSREDQRLYGYKEFLEIDGQIMTSRLDENVLRLLANRSGGRYVRINKASDFSFSLFAEKLELINRPGRAELFMYPLGLAIVLLCLGWFFTSEFIPSTKNKLEQKTFLKRWLTKRKDKNAQV